MYGAGGEGVEVLGIRSWGSDVTRGIALGSYGWKGKAWGAVGSVAVVRSLSTPTSTTAAGTGTSF